MPASEPIELRSNLIQRPYRGGSRLASFRGAQASDESWLPEDWVASVTPVFGQPILGLSRLGDDTFLRDAIRADPRSFLGPDHSEVFGSDTGVLVKLIDAAQRLAIHLHPSRALSRLHLGSCYGKTEAWQILDIRGSDAAVYLGFRDGIDPGDLLEIVERGDGASLLDRLNRLAIEPGDSVFVPAGMPHAIGAGVLVVEVQEPSDLLVRLEWVSAGPNAGPEAFLNDLGLGFRVALQDADCSPVDDVRLRELWRRGAVGATDVPVELLPGGARPFFRVEHVQPATRVEMEAGFAVLIVTRGSGELGWQGRAIDLRRGMTLLVPWSCGPTAVGGDVEILRCRPPDPCVAQESDPELRALTHTTAAHAGTGR